MTTVTYEVEGQWTTGARWRSYDAESRTEAEAIMAVAFLRKEHQPEYNFRIVRVTVTREVLGGAGIPPHHGVPQCLAR